jgi:hypothetical protein
MRQAQEALPLAVRREIAPRYGGETGRRTRGWDLTESTFKDNGPPL